LPTKIIVMAGTNNEEIVREVVRAGADGYLLKNGPSRHLTDAISYVYDGGQYFSPQLQRDGRDRHLLEEPPRPIGPPPATNRRQAADEEAPARPPGPKPQRRKHDPAGLRQRLREEATGTSLSDRDYEIMSMMADGIRPILDRLDEIDNRVALMESGDEEMPGDPRGWLSTELVRTYNSSTHGRENAMVGRTVADMEARLPQLIEQAVTQRFNQMAGKLQQEIEETHVRTLESFVKNIQGKLVQRVSALENDMTRQAEAMNQLRDYSQRTEENLSRLISGVDKLARDLPARLAASKAATESAETPENDDILPPPHSAPGPSVRPSRKAPESAPSPRRKIVVASAVALLVFGVIAWQTYRRFAKDYAAVRAFSNPLSSGGNSAPAASSAPQNRIRIATEAMDRKDYVVAEDAFRAVLQAEPQNVEAIKGLASALFRQDKTDEAAAMLDRLPKD
jgi:hypothetical protein